MEKKLFLVEFGMMDFFGFTTLVYPKKVPGDIPSTLGYRMFDVTQACVHPQTGYPRQHHWWLEVNKT